MPFSKRNRKAIRMVYRALTTYGSLKHAQGRLSAKRSPKTRQKLIAVAGGGLVAGLLAGAAFGARGGGCGHDHDHDHHDHDRADLPEASAREQSNGVPSDALKI